MDNFNFDQFDDIVKDNFYKDDFAHFNQDNDSVEDFSDEFDVLNDEEETLDFI